MDNKKLNSYACLALLERCLFEQLIKEEDVSINIINYLIDLVTDSTVSWLRDSSDDYLKNLLRFDGLDSIEELPLRDLIDDVTIMNSLSDESFSEVFYKSFDLNFINKLIEDSHYQIDEEENEGYLD